MVSRRIYFLRHKAGMSQAKLADKLNISASALGMYEQGRRMPGIDILIRLSTIFDVSLDYLVTGSEFIPSGKRNDDLHTPENCPCSTCYWKEYKK